MPPFNPEKRKMAIWAVAGGTCFCVLNIVTSGAVPGGAIGGALGAALGVAVYKIADKKRDGQS